MLSPDGRHAIGECPQALRSSPQSLRVASMVRCAGLLDEDDSVDEQRLRRLLDVGRSLITELDPEAVFERLLEVARELTGARYAAIGVLDERREGLERFLTAGIDEDTHRAIGDLPARARCPGRADQRAAAAAPGRRRRAPAVLRIPARPSSDDHVPGRTDRHRARGVGNLYLTEKDGGEFTDDDEEAAVVLADWAAIAITQRPPLSGRP